MTRKPILVESLTRKDLQPIKEALNSKRHFDLKQMVRQYLESGPNLEEMFRRNEQLGRIISTALEVFYLPTSTGQAHFAVSQEFHFKDRVFHPSLFEPDPNNPGSFLGLSEKGEDIVLFAQLTINPEWEYLGGPCERCHKYFVKKNTNQKTFCSRNCGNAATVLAYMQEKRKDARKEKVKQVEEALSEWNRKKQPDWKQFVSRNTKPKVTVAWLTRAVNEKWLRPPRTTQMAN